jgi:hypothetical protein
MKHVKLFEEFHNSLDDIQRQIISDAVLAGDLTASADYHENLEHSFEIECFNHEGRMSENEIKPEVRQKIAEEILAGKDFGIVEDEPLNVEWNIELDV